MVQEKLKANEKKHSCLLSERDEIISALCLELDSYLSVRYQDLWHILLVPWYNVFEKYYCNCLPIIESLIKSGCNQAESHDFSDHFHLSYLEFNKLKDSSEWQIFFANEILNIQNSDSIVAATRMCRANKGSYKNINYMKSISEIIRKFSFKLLDIFSSGNLCVCDFYAARSSRKLTFFLQLARLRASFLSLDFTGEYVDVDFDLRNNILENLRKKFPSHSTFLYLLMRFIPISHLEMQKVLENRFLISKNESRYFLSSYGHITNDLYKSYLVRIKARSKGKIAILSHGNYGILNESNHRHLIFEKEIADLLICSGADNYYGQKALQVSPPSKFMYCKPKVGERVVFVIEQTPCGPDYPEMQEWIGKYSKLLNFLSENVVGTKDFSISMRLYGDKNEAFQKLFFGQNGKGIDLIDSIGSEEFFSGPASLTVFTYHSTGFYQCIAANRPAIYLHPSDADLNDAFSGLFVLMKDSKLFVSEVSDIFMILSEFKSFEDWWFSQKTQAVVTAFQEHFSGTSVPYVNFEAELKELFHRNDLIP